MKLHPFLARRVRAALLASAAALATIASSHAALIAWGAPTNIAVDSDVSTNGTLVVAHNFGGTSVPSTTINGVTFLPFALNGGSNSVTVGNATLSAPNPINAAATTTFQALSASYLDLLTSAATLQADSVFTLEITGLTIGQTYEFQTWVNNSNRQNGPNFLFPTEVSDGVNTVTLYAGDDGTTRNIPPVPGQYVIGTFTASAVSQQVTYVNGEIDGWVNGFQLRQLGAPAVPEPGTALAGLAAMGLCGTWRRRQAV
jgi:hypothetical protein